MISTELVASIFDYLALSERATVSLVCNQWYLVFTGQQHWKTVVLNIAHRGAHQYVCHASSIKYHGSFAPVSHVFSMLCYSNCLQKMTIHLECTAEDVLNAVECISGATTLQDLTLDLCHLELGVKGALALAQLGRLTLKRLILLLSDNDLDDSSVTDLSKWLYSAASMQELTLYVLENEETTNIGCEDLANMWKLPGLKDFRLAIGRKGIAVVGAATVSALARGVARAKWVQFIHINHIGSMLGNRGCEAIMEWWTLVSPQYLFLNLHHSPLITDAELCIHVERSFQAIPITTLDIDWTSDHLRFGNEFVSAFESLRRLTMTKLILKLTYYNIGDPCVIALMNNLVYYHAASMQELELDFTCNDNITGLGVKAIANVWKLSSLETFSLSLGSRGGVSITADTVSALVVGLTRAHQIQCINIRLLGSMFSSDGCVSVAELCKLPLKNLLLDFYGSEIRDAEVSKLAAGLSQSTSMNSICLNFTDCRLRDRASLALASMKKIPSLTSLDLTLTLTDMSEFGASALGHLVAGSAILKKLYMDFNGGVLHTHGISALSGGLCQAEYLQSLHLALAGGSISNIRLTGLDNLRHIPHLHDLRLYLPQNEIETGLGAFAELAIQSPLLRVFHLDLKHNHICDDGAGDLAVLCRAIQLEELMLALFDNLLSSGGELILQQMATALKVIGLRSVIVDTTS